MVGFSTVNCEEHFVLASLNEFVKVWSSGHQAKLNIECRDGKASHSLQFLFGNPNSPYHHHKEGLPPQRYHQPSRRKGPARRERDH